MRKLTQAPHLRLAPEPRTVEDEGTPEERAYRAGRIEALASVVDISRAALANLERLEAMAVEELDSLIEFASALAHSKRNTRPVLSLVTDASELVSA